MLKLKETEIGYQFFGGVEKHRVINKYWRQKLIYFLEDFFGVVWEEEVVAFLALATTFLLLGLAPTFLVADAFLEGDFVVEATFFVFFSVGFLLAAFFFVLGVVAPAFFGAVLVVEVLVLGLADTFFLDCSFWEAESLKEAFTLVSFPDSTPLFKAFRRRC